MIGYLLSVAARRWPAEQREELTRDWAAELARRTMVVSVPAVPPGIRGAADPESFALMARGRWRWLTALAGALACTVAWALTLTWTTPYSGHGGLILPPDQPQYQDWPGYGSDEARLWVYEWRLFTALCVALCLVVAAVHRGRPIWPGIATGFALFAADRALVGTDRAVPANFPAVVGIALAAVLAFWGVTQLFGRQRTLIPDRRRTLAVVTVVSGLLAAGMFLGRFASVNDEPPPLLGLIAAVLPHAALALLVGVGLSTLTRRSGQGRPARPAILLGTGVLLLAVVGYGSVLGPVIGGVLAVAVWPLTLVLLLALGTAGRGLVIRGRHALLVTVAAVAGPFLALGATVFGYSFGTGLLGIVGYDVGYDGIPILPGQLFAAGGLGVAAAIVVAVMPSAMTAPRPAPRTPGGA